MRPISFTVYGISQPKGSARAFIRGGRPIVTSDNPSLAKWESAVRFAAQTVAERVDHRLFAGAVKIQGVFYLPRPKSASPRLRPFPTTRPDLSKLIRGAEDPLTGILWSDDAQVVAIETVKLYTDGPAKAVITVSQVLELTDLPLCARGA